VVNTGVDQTAPPEWRLFSGNNSVGSGAVFLSGGWDFDDSGIVNAGDESGGATAFTADVNIEYTLELLSPSY